MYRMYLIKKSIRKSKTYNMFLRVLVYIYIQQTRCIPYIQSAKRLFPITNWYVLRFFKVHTACTPRTYGTRNALNSFNFEKIEGCIRYV